MLGSTPSHKKLTVGGWGVVSDRVRAGRRGGEKGGKKKYGREIKRGVLLPLTEEVRKILQVFYKASLVSSGLPSANQHLSNGDEFASVLYIQLGLSFSPSLLPYCWTSI